MKLHEFISEALAEISLGVHKAKVDVKDIVAIAPGRLNGERHHETTKVKFDIAVNISENKNLKGHASGELKPEINVLGIRIGAGSLAADGSAETENTHQQSHRLQFEVPIILSANFHNDSTFDETAKPLRDLLAARREVEKK
ncbi:MAG: hypothetical protein GC129_04270 [Proteobacteria bacterium]|nr:hypothetical protein [Pseudomonadota bacterium]